MKTLLADSHACNGGILALLWMAWFLFPQMVQVVMKKISNSLKVLFSMNWPAMSIMSISVAVMSIKQSYHKAQVCLA